MFSSFFSTQIASQVFAERLSRSCKVVFHAPSDVGAEDYIGEFPQFAVSRQRFGTEDIRACPSNPMFIERMNQCLLVYYLAPGDVDQNKLLTSYSEAPLRQSTFWFLAPLEQVGSFFRQIGPEVRMGDSDEFLGSLFQGLLPEMGRSILSNDIVSQIPWDGYRCPWFKGGDNA